jgi:hypothetical protein
VRAQRWAEAAGGGVAHRGRVETLADTAEVADEGRDGVRVDAIGEGDPDVAAAGGTGLTDQVRHAGVVEELADGVGVGFDDLEPDVFGVEVEAEVAVAVFVVGEVHRPGA